MRWLRLVRAEIRKLTTTKLLGGFAGAAAVLGGFVLLAIVIGTEAEGVAGFVDTAEAQASLLSFGANALTLTGLFGAVAAAREYSHGTVVPMFLVGPRRSRTMLAKLVAVGLAGAVLGALGAVVTVGAGAIGLPLVDFELLLTGGTIARLVAGATLAGLVGAVLGVGVGALLRNTGGAVTVIVVVLLIAPSLLGQLVSEIARWIPNTLINVVSGVADDPGLFAATVALAAWGLIPAAAGMVSVNERDVI